MGKTYATCGHEITDSGIQLALRNTRFDYDTDCEIKVVDYVTYCADCAWSAVDNGDVLNTPEEEADWLSVPLC